MKEKEEKQKIDKKKSKVQHNDVGMARLFFNLGYADKILPQRLIGLINDTCDNKDIKIGKIDIMERFSYVDVDGYYANEIIEAFHGETYKRKPLIVEAANARKAGADKKSKKKQNSLPAETPKKKEAKVDKKNKRKDRNKDTDFAPKKGRKGRSRRGENFF